MSWLAALKVWVLSSSFGFIFEGCGLHGYGTWEQMKGKRGHRSREGHSGSPRVTEQNSWFLCCCKVREAEGIGDKQLGTLFGERQRGVVVSTWLLTSVQKLCPASVLWLGSQLLSWSKGVWNEGLACRDLCSV